MLTLTTEAVVKRNYLVSICLVTKALATFLSFLLYLLCRCYQQKCVSEMEETLADIFVHKSSLTTWYKLCPLDRYFIHQTLYLGVEEAVDSIECVVIAEAEVLGIGAGSPSRSVGYSASSSGCYRRLCECYHFWWVALIRQLSTNKTLFPIKSKPSFLIEILCWILSCQRWQ